MTRKFLLLFILILSAIIAPAQSIHGNANAQIDGHPAWIMQGNIYEVNIRQYTPEGTLKAFSKHLSRLKAMGVQTLWFMPINPISKVDRKGSLGSYYAVSDYTTINPAFGSLADWKSLVNQIHGLGMKVILDWVPNHTGADNRWLTEHPDFYVKDSTGKAAIAKDWSDTRQLNYDNPVMRDSMIAAMKYWIKVSNIDGFRCDVAWNVPGSFWKRCIGELKKMKPMFMLAEGDSAYLAKSGFDAVYPWRMYHMMEKVASGDRPAFALDSIRLEDDTLYPKHTIQMYFSSNHDENSWNKADFGTFPGDSHAPFAVFTQTMRNGVPLIYSGQEEPVLRALAFFEKDPIHFHKLGRAAFYKKLLMMRRQYPALSADADFIKLNAGDNKSVYAYLRHKKSSSDAGSWVLVVLNFSSKEQEINLPDNLGDALGLNPFNGKMEKIGRKSKIKSWGFRVAVYNKLTNPVFN
jgi:glycosidase